MKPFGAFTLLLFLALTAGGEISAPAFTAYLEPDANGANVSKDGIKEWTNPAETVSWLGQFRTAGKVAASVIMKSSQGAVSKRVMSVGKVPIVTELNMSKRWANQIQKITYNPVQEMGTGDAVTVKFGEFNLEKAGFVVFNLDSANAAGQPAGDIEALVLDGPATGTPPMPGLYTIPAAP